MEIRDIISVVKIPSVWPAVLFAENQIEVNKVQNETHTRIEKNDGKQNKYRNQRKT